MIGNKIKQFRIEKKLKQSELAEKLDVATRTIQNYESGNREPNIETIKKIATILKCNINELLDLENITEPKSNKLILSDEIKECLRLSTNEFKVNFRTSSYAQTKDLSEAILSLTRALSYQLQIEEKYNFESEEK